MPYVLNLHSVTCHLKTGGKKKEKKSWKQHWTNVDWYMFGNTGLGRVFSLQEVLNLNCTSTSGIFSSQRGGKGSIYRTQLNNMGCCARDLVGNVGFFLPLGQLTVPVICPTCMPFSCLACPPFFPINSFWLRWSKYPSCFPSISSV